jgi:hypothetical protein
MYKYQLEPVTQGFRVTRLRHLGKTYVPDHNSTPKIVTNMEMAVIDIPALFEHDDVVTRMRGAGL